MVILHRLLELKVKCNMNNEIYCKYEEDYEYYQILLDDDYFIVIKLPLKSYTKDELVNFCKTSNDFIIYDNLHKCEVKFYNGYTKEILEIIDYFVDKYFENLGKGDKFVY